MSEQTGLAAERLKHLEFIQAVVTRLGNSSFLIKGWTLTIAAAFFAVLAAKLNWGVAAVGLIPILGFWFLDGLFLRNERLFRHLYDDVRQAGTKVEPMSMDTKTYRSKATWQAATFSTTMFLFYGALVLVTVALVVAAVLRRH